MALAIESSVSDTTWLPVHLIQDAVDDREAARSMTPVFDVPTMLGVLAAVTERVRTGALVSPITLRNPAVLAKSITTTDVVSGARARSAFRRARARSRRGVEARRDHVP